MHLGCRWFVAFSLFVIDEVNIQTPQSFGLLNVPVEFFPFGNGWYFILSNWCGIPFGIDDCYNISLGVSFAQIAFVLYAHRRIWYNLVGKETIVLVRKLKQHVTLYGNPHELDIIV